MNRLPARSRRISPTDLVAGNLGTSLFRVALAIVHAGFLEEFLYRGCLLDRTVAYLARISQGMSMREGSKVRGCKTSEGSALKSYSTVRRGAGSEATQQTGGFQPSQPIDDDQCELDSMDYRWPLAILAVAVLFAVLHFHLGLMGIIFAFVWFILSSPV